MRFAIGLVTALVLLTACGSSGGKTSTSGTVKVVAAENFWGSVVSQLGGSHVSVTSIISDPNADPHQYESDAHDAGAVADAKLVIENGLGYDDFMSQLLGSTGSGGRTVVVAADVVGVHGNDANPHLWYSTEYVNAVAQAITTALQKLEPANASAFAANLQAFQASVADVRSVVDEIKAHFPGAPVAYTERVPGYMLADAGLVVKTPPGFAQANEDGTEPNASDTQAMDQLVTTHAIKALLYNAQATSAASTRARQLAQQNGIPVIAVTETLPPSEPSYQHWQLDQDQALLAALGR
jgi:zinc/manganese transport system substrate-binding protein